MMQNTVALLASRIEQELDVIPNESTTITALVHPFLKALGYDPGNPQDFVSEFVSDYSSKNGDCADGAILKNGKPIIILECKHCRISLTESHEKQLRKYFGVHPSAKLGVLTNGIEYRFFTDSEDKNIMDKKPFLVFDVSKPANVPYDALKLFSKSTYNSAVYGHLMAILRLKSKMTYEIMENCGVLAKIVFAAALNDPREGEKRLADEVLEIVRKMLSGTASEDQLYVHSTTGHWCSIAFSDRGNIVEVQFNPDTGKKWIRFGVLGSQVPIKAVSDLCRHVDELTRSAEILLQK